MTTAEQVLELRMPRLVIVAFGVVPAAFFWGLAIWIVAGGGGFNVLLALPVVWSAWLVMLARTGASVDARGIRLRSFTGRTRWIRWSEVDSFPVVQRGLVQDLYVHTTSGELVQVIGLPRRADRRRSGRPEKGVVAWLLAELHARLQAAERQVAPTERRGPA